MNSSRRQNSTPIRKNMYLRNNDRQVDIMPNYPYPKKIAKFCFLVVLCEVGSTLQHTKSWTELEYGKVSKNKM